jgi:hypothetical protein
MKQREIDWEAVLRAAAELQRLVPGAILVGGTAAAIHAAHRFSEDADHVLPDLRKRFESLIDLLEGREEWITHRVRAPELVLGRFLGVETGLRQLIRTKPLDTVVIDTKSGPITVPTPEEMLRIKGWLVIHRNATRDYIDLVALAARLGESRVKQAMSTFDACYRDVYRPDVNRDVSPLLQLARQLADAKPHDLADTDVAHYKGIVKPWGEWSAIARAARALSVQVTEASLGP